MLHRDALDAVLAHIADDARLAMWLTCKTFLALRPTGKILTSVCVMWATPALLEWAICIGCPQPDRISPLTARTVLQNLHELEPATIAQFAGAIVRMLRHPNISVTMYAADTLGTIEPELHAQIASVVTKMLTDTDPRVRVSALAALGQLKRQPVVQHTSTITPYLKAAHRCVRYSARELVGKLEHAALALHAGAIAGIQNDDECRVRYMAVTLLKVEPTEHTSNTSAIVHAHNDSVADVCAVSVEGMTQCEPTALTFHAGTETVVDVKGVALMFIVCLTAVASGPVFMGVCAAVSFIITVFASAHIRPIHMSGHLWVVGMCAPARGGM